MQGTPEWFYLTSYSDPLFCNISCIAFPLVCDAIHLYSTVEYRYIPYNHEYIKDVLGM